MKTLTDKIDASLGWYWKQTHYDNFRLIGPNGETFDYEDYLTLCWYCGRNKINPTQV